MKEFWKSIRFWQSYHHQFGGPLLGGHSVDETRRAAVDGYASDCCDFWPFDLISMSHVQVHTWWYVTQFRWKYLRRYCIHPVFRAITCSDLDLWPLISGGARVFAARGKRLYCRPPPITSNRYAVGNFHDFGHWGVNPSSSLSSPSCSFPSPPLKLSNLGERCRLHHRLGSTTKFEPKLNLVHFSLKICHLVAANLKIFLRIKWPYFMQNFQFFAEFGNMWIVQIIQLRLPVKQ